MLTLVRPVPPYDDLRSFFEPSEELATWLRETFIVEGGPLHNPDHAHLESARLGVLWTNVENVTKQRRVLGMAEMPMPPAASGKWARARWEQQIVGWFGNPLPDFILTFDASAAAALDDASWCALCEHELYHCAQARDEFGSPKFRRDNGLPFFAIRGHDVEEFTGVVRRYGIDAARAREFIAAGLAEPVVGAASIAAACGTCLRSAA